jgi:OOP family OmpA-OmpF porin
LVRFGVLAMLLAWPVIAVAGPTDRLELTGFLGVEDFSEQIGLGNALAPEQRPQTAPTFGGRLTFIALQTPGDLHLDLGAEAELSFTPAWTGYGFESARPSYFAPVFGYRANLLLRLGGGWFQPHVLGGAGGATVASQSPLMAKETDPVFAWGAGATFAVGGGWQLRFDGRQLRMEGMNDDTTSSYELLVAIGINIGAHARRHEPAAHVEVIAQPTRPPEPEPDRDRDNDGIPDRLDACPLQAEAVNGVDDQDGCPEPDPDGDKLVGAADRCPDRAEDVDQFEDDDGCPDEDNDKDGIADARDACPNEAENKNGITDDDGCPDKVPQEIVDALAAASQATFDRGKPRVPAKAKAALDQALRALLNNPRLKIVITVHPERAGDQDAELAKKRADNVRWYLLEQGVAQGSMTAAVGEVAPKNSPLLVLSIAP